MFAWMEESDGVTVDGMDIIVRHKVENPNHVFYIFRRKEDESIIFSVEMTLLESARLSHAIDCVVRGDMEEMTA